MKYTTFSFLLLLALAALAYAQSFGDVVITEVMYDDTVSTDLEWIEIHNTTAAAIDISDWVLTDGGTYPAPSSEGSIRVPAGTSLAADAYLVLSKLPIPEFAGEVVCTEFDAAWTLGNSGDNLALYTADPGGTLIDGSLTDQYPDLAATNAGYSIEKCDPNATWTSSPAAWHASSNVFALSGRYHNCTPGAPNSTCVDDTPPTIVSVTALNNTNVNVLFSEDVEQTSAEFESAYVVDSGVGSPISAVRDGGNLSLVHLSFSPMLNGTYTMTITGVQDMFGNEVDDSEPFTVSVTVNPGAVVITEVMYDDTATTDVEWIEIHNITGTTIDISDWIVTDDSVYPPTTEGYFVVPANTVIGPDQFLVLATADLDGITGEVICAVPDPSAFGNTGDNIALLTAGGGQVVDGSFTVNYPDLSPGNQGISIEKCDPDCTWSGDPAKWTASLVFHSFTGRYRYCTPGFSGFCCADLGGSGFVTVNSPGPGYWGYRLHHVFGCIGRVVFTNFCAGTTGETQGDALTAGWTAMAGGDGNDGDSIIFNGGTPVTEGILDGFVLYHPSCDDFVNWNVGDSSGTVDGPLPVELLTFTATARDGEVVLTWSTASESDNDHFEIIRDEATVANIAATNNATGSSYSWIDRDVTNGTTYAYSLVAVDINGGRQELATQNATPNANVTVITEYALYQNYPNPFNPETNITFDLLEGGLTSVKVFDLMGREVVTLVNRDLNAGRHTISFDASGLPSGVYLYKLNVNGFEAQNRMLLLK